MVLTRKRAAGTKQSPAHHDQPTVDSNLHSNLNLLASSASSQAVKKSPSPTKREGPSPTTQDDSHSTSESASDPLQVESQTIPVHTSSDLTEQSESLDSKQNIVSTATLPSEERLFSQETSSDPSFVTSETVVSQVANSVQSATSCVQSGVGKTFDVKVEFSNGVAPGTPHAQSLSLTPSGLAFGSVPSVTSLPVKIQTLRGPTKKPPGTKPYLVYRPKFGSKGKAKLPTVILNAASTQKAPATSLSRAGMCAAYTLCATPGKDGGPTQHILVPVSRAESAGTSLLGARSVKPSAPGICSSSGSSFLSKPVSALSRVGLNNSMMNMTNRTRPITLPVLPPPTTAPLTTPSLSQTLSKLAHTARANMSTKQASPVEIPPDLTEQTKQTEQTKLENTADVTKVFTTTSQAKTSTMTVPLTSQATTVNITEKTNKVTSQATAGNIKEKTNKAQFNTSTQTKTTTHFQNICPRPLPPVVPQIKPMFRPKLRASPPAQPVSQGLSLPQLPAPMPKSTSTSSNSGETEIICWDHASTLKLIDLYKEHRVYLTDHHYKKKSVWERIAFKLRHSNPDGPLFCWNHVENKWKNMTKKYRDCIDMRRRGVTVRCNYFNEIAAIYNYPPEEEQAADGLQTLKSPVRSFNLNTNPQVESDQKPGTAGKRDSTAADISDSEHLLVKKKKYAHLDRDAKPQYTASIYVPLHPPLTEATRSGGGSVSESGGGSMNGSGSVNGNVGGNAAGIVGSCVGESVDGSVRGNMRESVDGNMGGSMSGNVGDVNIVSLLEQLRGERARQDQARMERLETMHREKMTMFSQFLDILRQSKQS